MKQDEKKVLGIIALVFGSIALITSWMPFINNASAILAIVGFIVGIIALIVNRKNKKTITIISLIISIIAFAVVLITQASYSAMIDSAFESNTKTAKKESTFSSKDSEETTEISEKEEFSVGEKIIFDGEAEYTITGVEWTDERNQFEETQPDKVLKVTYNVTNLSDSDVSIGLDLTLYADGRKMESYPNTNTMESISKGRSFEGAVQHFAVTGEGPYELEVEPSFSWDVEPAIVKLDLQ
jgi:hypothetical protein